MYHRLFRSSRWRMVRVGVVAALAATVLAPAHAAPGDLYHLTGDVEDAWGHDLNGTTIKDQNNKSTTAAAGRYSLGQGATLGPFTLTATRSDLAQRSLIANPALPVDGAAGTENDFAGPTALLYKTTVSLSRTETTTRLGPATITVSIDSYAPNPGSPGDTGDRSCVSVTDSSGGTTGPATLVSSGSPSKWSYTISLAANTPEATYTASATARDCSSGLLVGQTTSRPYVVDNTPPLIPASSLVPLDHSAVLVGSLPLSAKVTDAGGSGVNASALSIMRTDGTTAETFSGSALSYDSASKVVRTVDAKANAANKNYRLRVHAEDRAGNIAEVGHAPGDGGGYSTASITTQSSTASIPPTKCELSAGSTPATRKVTCSNVPVTVASSSATASSVFRMPARLFVDHQFSLTTAKLRPTPDSATFVPAYDANSAAWGPKTRAVQHAFGSASDTAQTAVAPTSTHALPETLVAAVEVPLSWTDAYLVMDGSDAASTTPAVAACSAAITSSCDPDPFSPYRVVTLKTGQDLSATRTRLASSFDLQLLDSDAAANSFLAAGSARVFPAIASDASVQLLARASHFGFDLSEGAIAATDVTGTPSADAEVAEVIAEHPRQHTDCAKVFDVDMALGADSGGSNTAVAFSPLLGLTSTISRDGLSVEEAGASQDAVSNCTPNTGTAVADEGSTGPPPDPGPGWEPMTADPCFTVRKYKTGVMSACRDQFKKTTDSFADRDLWGTRMWGTARAKNPSIRQYELRGMWIQLQELTGDSQTFRQKNPDADDEENAGDCKVYTVGISEPITLEHSREICDYQYTRVDYPDNNTDVQFKLNWHGDVVADRKTALGFTVSTNAFGPNYTADNVYTYGAKTQVVDICEQFTCYFIIA